jgi:hypothetical protein
VRQEIHTITNQHIKHKLTLPPPVAIRGLAPESMSENSAAVQILFTGQWTTYQYPTCICGDQKTKISLPHMSFIAK